MQQLSLTDLRGRLLGCALGLVLFYTVGAASFVPFESFRRGDCIEFQCILNPVGFHEVSLRVRCFSG